MCKVKEQSSDLERYLNPNIHQNDESIGDPKKWNWESFNLSGTDWQSSFSDYQISADEAELLIEHHLRNGIISKVYLATDEFSDRESIEQDSQYHHSSLKKLKMAIGPYNYGNLWESARIELSDLILNARTFFRAKEDNNRGLMESLYNRIIQESRALKLLS